MTSVSLPDPVVLRTGPPRVDVRALERALRERAGGEVRFDAGSRGAYSTDASNYRQIPIGVVVPRTVDDAVQAIAVCREHGATPPKCLAGRHQVGDEPGKGAFPGLRVAPAQHGGRMDGAHYQPSPWPDCCFLYLSFVLADPEPRAEHGLARHGA